MAAHLQRQHMFGAALPLLGRGAVVFWIRSCARGVFGYAANTVEPGRKSLKQFPRRRNAGQLLLQVSEAVQSEAESCFYTWLQQSVTESP